MRSSQPEVPDAVARAHRVEHVERHQRQRPGVVGARRRNARGDHVAVADRLDLLEPVPLGEHVEVAEQVVEDADDLGRREVAPTSGVKSTTSANRIDAAPNWSAIVCGSAFSRSAIERGRMFSSRFSALRLLAPQRGERIARAAARTAPAA